MLVTFIVTYMFHFHKEELLNTHIV